MKSKKKVVVLGVTGGIAAYKTVPLIRALQKKGYTVIPVLTRSAMYFVNKREIEHAANGPVFTELFPRTFSYQEVLNSRNVDHIRVAQAADAVVVAPATANILAKMAHGIADDFLTTTLLATRAPILVCPSMNPNMWNNPLVQENVAKIRQSGAAILEPTNGVLACGYEGVGKLPDANSIVDEVVRMVNKHNMLSGISIIVTAGGTMEPIDGVRYVTNRSSGKMGAAVADVCWKRGASVTLLKAKHAAPPRHVTDICEFETADELSALLEEKTKRRNVCFHAAAVSDFAISPSSGKLPSNRNYVLSLTPREKIYAGLTTQNPALRLFLFKAHWRESLARVIRNAREMMIAAGARAVIANDVGHSDRGFSVDTNEVTIIFQNGAFHTIPLAPKPVVAEQIVDTLLGNPTDRIRSS